MGRIEANLQSHVHRGEIQPPQMMLGVWNGSKWVHEGKGSHQDVIINDIVMSGDLSGVLQPSIDPDFDHVQRRFVSDSYGVIVAGQSVYLPKDGRWGRLHGYVDTDKHGSHDKSPYCFVQIPGRKNVIFPVNEFDQHAELESPRGIRFGKEHDLRGNGPTFRVNRWYEYQGLRVRTKRFELICNEQERLLAITVVLEIPHGEHPSDHISLPLFSLFHDKTFSGYNTYSRFADDTIHRLPPPEQFARYYKTPSQS
jgi:hypothetical protein